MTLHFASTTNNNSNNNNKICTFSEENVSGACCSKPRVFCVIAREPTLMSVRCSATEIWLHVVARVL